MTISSAPLSINRPAAGITFILVGMIAISVNDMLIKLLSGAYPLHQMVFIRSSVGICFSMMLVWFEGGWSILKTRNPLLHLSRGILIVLSNLTFFTALAVISLADATALFFVAPLLITLLSIPVLGEKVGPFRLGAVAVGFLGVVIMIEPWKEEREIAIAILLLPVLSAFAYALNQVVTRKLGATTKASALAVYVQAMFILVSIGFYLVAGDGHFVTAESSGSMRFLLRPWTWPQGTDIWLFVILGLNSAIVGYCIAQAYRMADAATVAPFEYVGVPMAVFWGWLLWQQLPSLPTLAGIFLIAGSGLFVFLRERQKQQRIVSERVINRRY
ncbi:MAG: DMT family transporter [Nitratireductor sp.]|nr:DMT family transporter [Nitratireductor sp.]MCB1458750.1 DMT family transporter [Nitratireductor sp.]